MAGRSPAEAVDRLYRPLQLAVSCITNAVLIGRATQVTPQPHVARFGQQEGVVLGRSGQLRLVVRLQYQLVGSPAGARQWVTDIVGYSYRLLDRQEQEFLAYHWHPAGPSPVVFPHLHIGGRTTPVDLSKAHLPTGPITLIAVIRLAISDLGVEPLRPDWDTVLDEAERQLRA